MKTFSIFVFVFVSIIVLSGCEVDHVPGDDGPIFLESPSERSEIVEICDPVGGLCWSYPINIDYSSSYDSFTFSSLEEDGVDPCESLPGGFRVATPDEFRDASKRCLFEYYAIITEEDLIKCNNFDCELNGDESDLIKDSWNRVAYCTNEIVPSSHQYVRCVKSID